MKIKIGRRRWRLSVLAILVAKWLWAGRKVTIQHRSSFFPGRDLRWPITLERHLNNCADAMFVAANGHDAYLKSRMIDLLTWEPTFSDYRRAKKCNVRIDIEKVSTLEGGEL